MTPKASFAEAPTPGFSASSREGALALSRGPRHHVGPRATPAAGTVSAAFPPGAPGAPDDAVERTVLGNGLTVLVRRDASAPVVAIVTHVKAGYFDEPDDVVGVSHVLEHMYFKGTPARGPGEIARDTKAAGGYLNAGTIYDHTNYYTVLPASSFAAGLAVQADAFANSLIDANELARELEVIVEEESRKRDTASAVATEACYALLHDVHRMRRWRMGTAEGLRRLTRDDVWTFYRAHYVPSNTILSVVGDIDPGRALAEIDALYGGLTAATAPRDRGRPEPPRAGFRCLDLVRDVGQAQLVIGWRTVAPLHADAPPLDIVAALLGVGRASRLYREVREKSLASVVGAYHYTPTELGVLAVAAATPAGGLRPAAHAVWNEVRTLSEREPSAGELRRVQRGIEARWWRNLESMEGQATYLASWQALGGWELGASYLSSLLATSPSSVQAAAASYLTIDRSALVTVRAGDMPALAADRADARALLDERRVVSAVRRDAAPVEAPGLVGLGLRPERVVHDVSVFETERGVPVLVRRKPGAPMAHVHALFLGGVSDESASNAGLTTLLARTALQGTARRDGPQLAEDVESLGGAISCVVASDVCGWTMSVPTAWLGPALAMLAEVVEEPAFAAGALDTERAIALAGLEQLRDDMSRQPVRLALAAAFGDDPYGRPTAGTEAGLHYCGAAELRATHERLVRGGQGAIIVVADAPAEDVAAAVRGAFLGLSCNPRIAAEPLKWPTESRESIESRDKAQTAFSILFRGPTRSSPERHAATALSAVASGLGGRLFQALRDQESLAYSVHLGARALPRAGWLAAYLACAPSKEDAARAGLMRECRRLAEEPVSADELARAKAYLLGSLAIRQQSAASVLGDIADAWQLGTLEDLDEEPRAIAALTADDLQAVARDSFDIGRAVWGVVRGR
jgi:zinc protease